MESYQSEKSWGLCRCVSVPTKLGEMGSLTDRCRCFETSDQGRYNTKKADKPLYILAPVIAFAPAFMVLATLPFTDAFQFADIGIGLLYYIAISGISTIGIVTAGWASNNKYSLIGGMRAAAQMISYEIPLVMSLVGIVLLTGSLNLNEIVAAQEKVWFIFLQPIAFIVFFIASVAELNRVPFDLPGAESNLLQAIMLNTLDFVGPSLCYPNMCICLQWPR